MEGDAFIVDVVKEIIEEEPPQLFDLTGLQKEANSRYGLTADETLKCAQSLYESGMLSYPRTSSHSITPDMEPTVSALLSGSEDSASMEPLSSRTEYATGGNSSTIEEESNRNYLPGSEVSSSLIDANKNENKSSELGNSLAESRKLADITIHNSGKTISGVELVGEQIEVNDYFRGDQFSRIDSYENCFEQLRKEELINANAATTCDLNSNLDGKLDANSSSFDLMSDKQKALVKELTIMRETVPTISEDTVMQKVISEEQVKEYIRPKDPKIQVSGCASKAADVAPYTNNSRQAYETLRLDYIGSPYKEIADNKGDIFIMRFTSDYCPDNSAYPKMDGTEPWNKPPCTGTGYTGSKEHLVPEYTYGRGQEISDGAIYKVDYEGNETIVAIWAHGKFEKVE